MSIHNRWVKLALLVALCVVALAACAQAQPTNPPNPSGQRSDTYDDFFNGPPQRPPQEAPKEKGFQLQNPLHERELCGLGVKCRT